MSAGGAGGQNLFGTDGIRDRAGEGVLAAPSLRRLGAALAEFARDRAAKRQPGILVGRDTRLSGAAIEATLAGALAAAGCRPESGGVLPTPAVSLLLPECGFDLGVVVSASHTPAHFNGIKVLDALGRKLGVEDELEISERFGRTSGGGGSDLALAVRSDLLDRYVALLLDAFGGGGFLSGSKVVLDCAEGATSAAAPAAFRRAGAEVASLFDSADGARINDGCGSLHTDALQAEVRRRGADLGVAFDGDGDRAILVDERGEVVDGDEMLALLALPLYERGALPSGEIVATVMSNAGMETYLRDRGIGIRRVPVGDREVWAEMERRGLALGGEQSGHIIFAAEARTGDGIRTGLHMARRVAEARAPLSELRRAVPRYPQTLLAVEVERKPPIEQLGEVTALRDAAVRALDGRGRVLLRYSGTEPLLRVLVEGPERAETDRWAGRIAAAVRAEIGAR